MGGGYWMPIIQGMNAIGDKKKNTTMFIGVQFARLLGNPIGHTSGIEEKKYIWQKLSILKISEKNT